MPIWLGWMIAAAIGGGSVLAVGKSVQDVGQGLDLAGTGFLKLAAAGGVAVGAWILLQRFT